MSLLCSNLKTNGTGKFAPIVFLFSTFLKHFFCREEKVREGRRGKVKGRNRILAHVLGQSCPFPVEQGRQDTQPGL
jgi:hypothetical protein